MPEQSVGPLRDLICSYISRSIAEPSPDAANPARFAIKASLGGGTCAAEGALTYVLPNGQKLTHKSDILLTLADGTHIGIELKYLSAVTDQFKTRSYDIIHLKQTFGERFCGMMIYVHVPGIGISLDRAKAICYLFDRFLGFELKLNEHDADKKVADALTPILASILEAISRVLSERSAGRAAAVTAT
jgi:hypothetical protein